MSERLTVIVALEVEVVKVEVEVEVVQVEVEVVRIEVEVVRVEVYVEFTRLRSRSSTLWCATSTPTPSAAPCLGCLFVDR